MKASHLRIGNYVDLYGSVAQVQRADFDTGFKHGIAVDKGKPIKLTKEWLLRFGFIEGVKQKRHGNGFDYQPKDVYTTWIDYELNENIKYRISSWHHTNGIDNQDVFIFHDHSLIKCEYVHQLQNLFHSLTGEELTLKNKA
jgi:hypothetical protein